jgi:predicted ester cyclase
MSALENKTVLRRYFQEVWEKQNPAAATQFLASNYRRYTSPDAAPLALDGQLQRLYGFRTVFPDIQIVVEEVIAEGDYMAFRSTMRGTHQGELLGIAPTGKQVTVGLIDVIRVENGKFVEQWGGPDLFDLLRQLGAVFSVAAERNEDWEQV